MFLREERFIEFSEEIGLAAPCRSTAFLPSSPRRSTGESAGSPSGCRSVFYRRTIFIRSLRAYNYLDPMHIRIVVKRLKTLLEKMGSLYS